MKIKLKNVGVEKISKIYIANDEEIFGFKLKEENVNIEPQSEH